MKSGLTRFSKFHGKLHLINCCMEKMKRINLEFRKLHIETGDAKSRENLVIEL